MVIQTEDVLFNLWQITFLRHSAWFREQLKGPEVPPCNDGYPMFLEGVKSSEFERLLWILYPQVIGKYRASTAEDWVIILDLATRWEFQDVRELAITQLDGMKFDAVDKLEVMKKYKVDSQWGYSAITELCSRTHPLTVEEGRKLGIELSINICRIRERLEKWGRMKANEVKKVVNEVLELQEPTSPK